MRVPASAKWVLLALAGLAIAIGVAIAAANLTSQQIGIASESVSAGDVLAPSLRPEEGANKDRGGHGKPPTEETTTTPAEPTPPGAEITPSEPAEPQPERGSDDYGGSGGGDD